MALERQLYDFMPHVVTIFPYSARNNYGEDTHSGVSRSARAYVEPTKVRDTMNDTQEVHQPKRIYVADTSITLQDKIVLPDGTSPKITTVERHVEVLGLEHTVVTFA